MKGRVNKETQKRIIAEIEVARIRGVPDGEIATTISERFHITARTVRERYLALASKQALRRTVHNRSELLARQTDRLEHAMRLALANKDHKTVHEVQWKETTTKAGAVTRTPRTVQRTELVPAPRLGDFIEANRELHRIHGLHAPDRLEVVHIHLKQTLEVVISAIRAEVQDDDLCQRIWQRLQLVADHAETQGDSDLSRFRGKHRRVVGHLSPPDE